MDRRILGLLVTAWLSSTSLGTKSEAFGADPVSQCISANEESLTLRKEGKLVEARRALAACAAPVCPEAIQRACRGRMTDFNEAVPTVVFEVKDARGRDMVDVKVSVDGQPMAALSLTAQPLDPGAHVFRFEAPGQAVVESTIVVHEGQKDQPVIVVFHVNPSPPAPGAESSAGEAAAGSVSGPSTLPGSVQRTVGWVVGGAGIATMAVGGILALVAKSSFDSASVDCNAANACNSAGFGTRISAWRLGNAATGVFVAGAVVTAAGGVIWLSAPQRHQVVAAPSWRVGLAPNGVVAEETF